MNKVSFFSLVIASSCLSVSVSAKNLQDYVFPPLEQEPMNDSAEQKYQPNAYMSYSNHKNSSFFQQSDYVFPEIRKSVSVKPTFPSAKDYEMAAIKKRKAVTSKYDEYPYTVPTYTNNTSVPKNKNQQSISYQRNIVRPTKHMSNSSYRYPNYSTTTNNNMFDVNNWNPMNGKLPMFPGMGNSSMFNSNGMRMPNFF